MDLKKRRKELKMTQTDVAKKVGVSLVSYQTWERGVGSPNDENKIKLYDALKLDKEE